MFYCLCGPLIYFICFVQKQLRRFCCILSICVKHSAFILLPFKMFIEPIYGFHASFDFQSCRILRCSHAHVCSHLFCCKYVHFHFILVFRPAATRQWWFSFSKVKMSLCWFHLYISFKKVLHNKVIEETFCTFCGVRVLQTVRQHALTCSSAALFLKLK